MKEFIFDHPGKKHQDNLLCSLAVIIKKLILHDWEKEYTVLDQCLTWQNYHKSGREKIQWSKFISAGAGALTFLVGIKNLEQ